MKLHLIAAVFFILIASVASAQIPTTIGWTTLSGTILNNVCAANQGFPGIIGSTGCSAIYSAWNSAVMDTTRNRLVIWGGGHTDYYGNEIYAVDLDANPVTLIRLNDPSTNSSQGSCVESIGSPVAPNSRHTYAGLTYIPYLDWLFLSGGSLACPTGASSNQTWRSSLATLASTPQASWFNLGPTGANPGTSESKCLDYDRNTGKVIMYVPQSFGGGTNGIHRYNPQANIWTRETNDSANLGLNCVIDPVRKVFWAFGRSQQFKWNIKNGVTAARQAAGTTAATTCAFSDWPGLAYDPVQDKIICWNGGNTVYVLDPDTLVWTTQNFTGGPTQAAVGTLGRFRYSPKWNAFVVCNFTNTACSALRMTAADTAKHNYVKRAYEPGVMRAIGMDNVADITGATTVDASGLIPGQGTVVLDSTVASSGSAVKITCAPGENCNPNLFYNFSEDYQTQFDSGQIFYVSWRQRMTPEMLAFGTAAGGEFKMVHIGTGSIGVGSNNTAFSCTNLEIVPQHTNAWGFIRMYNACPGPNTVNYDENRGGGDFYLQSKLQGSPFCLYSKRPISQGGTGPEGGGGFYSPNGTCVQLHSNEWQTFKVKVTLGTRSGSFWNGSHVQMWMAYDGATTWSLIHDWTYGVNGTQQHYAGNRNGNTWAVDEKYGQLYLDMRTADNFAATVSTWYDEVIISRNDIALPGQAIQSPNPPTITITSPTSNPSTTVTISTITIGGTSTP